MMNVLVVGALDALDEAAVEWLKENDIEVLSTDDTQAGLAAGLRRNPDLVFVEVDSPGSQRFEAITQVRREGQNGCRIVAVCNGYTPHGNELCTSMGADFTIPQTSDWNNVGRLIRGIQWLDGVGAGRRNNCGEPVRVIAPTQGVPMVDGRSGR